MHKGSGSYNGDYLIPNQNIRVDTCREKRLAWKARAQNFPWRKSPSLLSWLYQWHDPQCSHTSVSWLTPTTHLRLVITTLTTALRNACRPHSAHETRPEITLSKMAQVCALPTGGQCCSPVGTLSSVKSHPQRTAVQGGLQVTSPLVPSANTLDTCSRTGFGAGSKDLKWKMRSYTACQKLTLKRKGFRCSIQFFTFDG